MDQGPGSVWGWQGWEMGKCFVGRCPCFVELELGTRVVSAGEGGRGLGRGRTGEIVGFVSLSFTCIPLHHEEQPSPAPRPGLSASPGHGCIELEEFSKPLCEVKEDSSS